MSKFGVYEPGPPIMALAAPGECQLTAEYVDLPLVSRLQISKDTFVFTFATPDRTKPLNLSTCACILAKFTDAEGEPCIRPYTPLSTNAMVGQFQCMIKVYPLGKMTQHIASLKVGDTLSFKHIKYNVKIQYPFNKKFVGMIAGGSGITPMFQTLHALLGDKESETEVVVLFGNRTSEDILGGQVLDKWAADHPRLTVVHALSQEPEESSWGGVRGRIQGELIQKHFPAPSDDSLIFVCGPIPMYESISGLRSAPELTGALADLGYTPSQVVKF